VVNTGRSFTAHIIDKFLVSKEKCVMDVCVYGVGYLALPPGSSDGSPIKFQASTSAPTKTESSVGYRN
jgi:hypothetical protein